MMPWVHMHLWPDGRMLPCCVADSSKPLTPLNDNPKLSETWNSRPLRNLRQRMLSGQTSSECKRCQFIEANGSKSLRQVANDKFAHHWSQVESTGSDGEVKDIKMAYLDMRFSNLCNFRCRTCGPQLSSSWYADQIQLDPDYSQRMHLKAGEGSEFWRQLQPLLLDVEEAYFAGGEPLLSDQHLRILEYWIANKHTDLGISYSTNFSQLSVDTTRLFDLWKHFPRVRISASLDAMGNRAEYLRQGTHWPVIEKNRFQLSKECPHVEFEISPTISVFNVWHFPDFHRHWVEKGLLKPENTRINILSDPEFMRIEILAENFRHETINKYHSHLEWLSLDNEIDQTDMLSTGLNSVIERLKLNKQELRQQFLKRNCLIDSLRNQSLLDVFPELQGTFNPKGGASRLREPYARA